MEEAGRVVRDPLVGSVLHERYRLLRRIGRGGMGIVYLAEHVLIGRKYAVKVLSERANATDEMVARFHREATAAAAVASDHVVDVTDMGQLEDGSFFLVLEYLEGVELAQAVLTSGPFEASRAVKIVCQLCDALSAVHDKGIVHRDLKPENLFLIEHNGSKDFLKVLDFGVCKLVDASVDADSELPVLTRTNASLGTPQYMAPEQFRESARVDHRVDIHAAGAVLYFMLTGKPPFDAPTLPQLYMRASVEPPPTLLAQRPELPAGLDAVLQRAMAKHPDDRFPTSAALKAALLPFRDLRSAPGGAPVTLPGPASTTHPTQPAHTPLEAAAPATSWGSATADAAVLLRWRWPLALASTLGLAAISLLLLGAWALSSGDAHVPTDSPRSQAPGAARPREPELMLEPPRPATTLGPEDSEESVAHRPLKQTKTVSKRGRPAQRLALEPAEPERDQPVAMPPTEPVTPAWKPSSPSRNGDTSYHFPKRALKDVF